MIGAYAAKRIVRPAAFTAALLLGAGQGAGALGADSVAVEGGDGAHWRKSLSPHDGAPRTCSASRSPSRA